MDWMVKWLVLEARFTVSSKNCPLPIITDINALIK